MWVVCEGCGLPVSQKSFVSSLRVCPGCGRYGRLTAGERIAQLLDEGSVRAIAEPEVVEDPLGFAGYRERLKETRRRTGSGDAVICVRGAICGRPVVAAVMDFRFLGGSLGCAAGESLAVAAEAALCDQVPFLTVTASGGARMQEGALSLMQMAKVTQALTALDESGLLTVTIVTDPTYGGVAASFATQADVILAERGARLGFAGPRVIEQTIRQELPPGFQTADFLYERGLIDGVVSRRRLRPTLARLLEVTEPGARATPRLAASPVIRCAGQLPERDPWEVVRLARTIERPTTLDYAGLLLDGFHELHGDRVGGDCGAIVGGMGRLLNRPVMLIGHQKGHTAQELKAANFGMPTPAGYRKAARMMRLAAKLGLPVVTLVDTPGAHPGVEAERDGQAWAIAENLRLMSTLPVPIVTVITGEGGSGGALALAVADRVLAMQNSVYSVISPEGCAAILWKDAQSAPDAARSLRIAPGELLRYGITDGVIPEPAGGAHRDHAAAADLLSHALADELTDLTRKNAAQLLRERTERFRAFGVVPADRSEGGAA